MTYRKDTKTMLYRSKMNPNLKRNFALFPVLDLSAYPHMQTSVRSSKKLFNT